MYSLTAFISSFLPLIVYGAPITATGIIDKATNALSTTIIGTTFIFATMVFLWGVVVFITKADNPEERKKAKRLMIWGIVGLAVIATAWGLVKVLSDFFHVSGVGVPQPTFPK